MTIHAEKLVENRGLRSWVKYSRVPLPARIPSRIAAAAQTASAIMVAGIDAPKANCNASSLGFQSPADRPRSSLLPSAASAFGVERCLLFISESYPWLWLIVALELLAISS